MKVGNMSWQDGFHLIINIIHGLSWDHRDIAI